MGGRDTYLGDSPKIFKSAEMEVADGSKRCRIGSALDARALSKFVA